MAYTSRIATSLIALFLASSLLDQAALAQSFTVLSGETRTTTQTMAGAGDVGIVEVDGKINTTGLHAYGIYSSGANAWVTQSGTISTAGNSAYGIYSSGADARITQSGTISTAGNNAYGIYSSNADAGIIQSGRISTTGGSAFGIYSTGARARITQRGTISTTGNNAYGIASSSTNAVINQSGTISIAGDNAAGVVSSNTGTQITNGGLIRATGTGSYAIRIWHSATSNTLTLKPGSRLEGTVNIDPLAASSFMLNLEGGQSSVIQFVGAMPGTINASSDVAYAADPVSMQLLAADVTLQQTSGARFDQLIGATFGALAARGAGSVGPSVASFAPLAYAATPDGPDAMFAGFAADPAVRATNAWARGFGSMSEQATLVANRNHLYGLGGIIVGADTQLSPDWTVGLFAGASLGQARIGDDRLNDASLFGGAYGQGVFGDTTLDIALALGTAYYNSSRMVSTIGGMQTATASYGGLFIAPELGLTQRLDLGGQAVEAGVSVRYQGLFRDGYTETGSLANLTIDASATHQLAARAQIAVPFETYYEGGGLTRVTPRLGAEVNSQFGADTATGTIAGHATRFSIGNGESLLGFAGLRFEQETAGSLSFSGDIEAVLGRNGSTRMLANAGIKASF